MRKLLLIWMTVCLVAIMAPTVVGAKVNDHLAWLDTAQLDTGVVGIRYDVPKGISTKLVIKKENISYTYNLNTSSEVEYFALQSNDGTYAISILQHVSGNKYKAMYATTVELKLDNPNSVYLASIQNVNWSESKAVVEKATQLTKDLKTDKEKVKAIYDYVIDTIQYDYDLATKVATGYVPNIDEIFINEQGICYDYAALFAAMSRSAGVPTKLLMGTTEYVTSYHAWNEVYVNDEWITVDTTIDAGKSGNKMFKDSTKYKTTKVY